MNLEFYKGKRVFITGHTGFKGSWLCRFLVNAGAEVTGYSLEPPTEPNLFTIAGLEGKITSVIGDIRDRDKLLKVFQNAHPEIVFHFAAQPIVRESYRNPSYTYETNVMGTVNLLECVRTLQEPVKSVVIVTTDKVYENKNWVWGYRESDPLDSYDPYSNSKSCTELVVHGYVNSFFAQRGLPVSTVRAGNVIGGGDFANDRIIPDCIRAAQSGILIPVRNPYSIRPYQHVLEALLAYLLVAQRQYEDKTLAGWYNIGPDDIGCVTTGELVDMFCQAWGDGLNWENQAEINAPHEDNFLKLDCSKIKSVLGWKPVWNVRIAVEKTVEWARAWLKNDNIAQVMDRQICEYLYDYER